MAIAAGIESGAASRATSPPSATRMSRGGWVRRGLLVASFLAGAGWAAHAASPAETADAVTRAGQELTRLLRFMAVTKVGLAAGVLAAVWWRLALPAGAGRLLAYLAAASAAGAGPVLIWGMVQVGLGSLLLHGGLFAAMALLWCDPEVAIRLGAMVAERRHALGSTAWRPPRHPASLHRGAEGGSAPTLLNAAAGSGTPAPRPCRFPPGR